MLGRGKRHALPRLAAHHGPKGSWARTAERGPSPAGGRTRRARFAVASSWDDFVFSISDRRIKVNNLNALSTDIKEILESSTPATSPWRSRFRHAGSLAHHQGRKAPSMTTP